MALKELTMTDCGGSSETDSETETESETKAAAPLRPLNVVVDELAKFGDGAAWRRRATGGCWRVHNGIWRWRGGSECLCLCW